MIYVLICSTQYLLNKMMYYCSSKPNFSLKCYPTKMVIECFVIVRLGSYESKNLIVRLGSYESKNLIVRLDSYESKNLIVRLDSYESLNVLR